MKTSATLLPIPEKRIAIERSFNWPILRREDRHTIAKPRGILHCRCLEAILIFEAPEDFENS
jgi:hypothetical protein